jgi:hypothetical protein
MMTMMLRLASLSVLLAVVSAEPLTFEQKEELAKKSDMDDPPPGVQVRVVGGTQVTSKSKYPFLVEWEGKWAVCMKCN